MFSCKNSLNCTSCGKCCIIRNKELKTYFSETEDLYLREKIYENKGIIYLYPLDNYTISISIDERKKLINLAKNRNIKLKVLPKKIIITDGKIHIIDYFLDHDVCPFLKPPNFCNIYKHRPKVCKVFPKPYSIQNKILENASFGSHEISFNDALKFCKKSILLLK